MPRAVVGAVVAAVAFAGTLGACRAVTSDPAPAGTVTASPDVAVAKSAPPAPAPPTEFTVLAAGDLLPHDPVVRSAGGGDEFGRLLDGLDDWVEGADLALCHLEVPVAPTGTAPSGYPMFGAPAGLVPALAEQGWDGCSTASNHSVDRGYDGVVTTLDALDEAGMGHVGTARSAAEKKAPQLYEIERAGRTLTVAHLSATYGLNGLPMPSQAPWAVTLIDAGRLVAQAERARRDGADLVLVSLHAGVEYTENLTDQQVDVVAALAESGAVDLVIGHHAHVPQRIDDVPGGPGGDGMWVAYGLGNLLSNQSADCCDVRTSNGVLLVADVTQERPGSPARVVDVTWTGSTVDIAAGHRVHALPDVLDDAAATTLSAGELAAREDRVAAAVGDAAAERTEAPEPTGPEPEVVGRTD
ncbi:poly-gamma-glutamate synthesis protein (capsule biosynthesis protein) [Isoptericola jiangsuensis]|uniref:Poly-gamma-glutamate synthesis protein (Capsule biosynthesis protein) n=1 Tax=Isoptericola jiangsuensis TaxID=548579 RepID=A0A2A9EXA0_9MICO|nr:poly-gamma-glutamate synthesis protein (capsule biosynthesis protein) [Isoptericola jiangsuensis]